jgi:dihydrofolate reductase
VWGNLKSELFAPGVSDDGYLGATKAMLLAYAVNAPAVVVKMYDSGKSNGKEKFSAAWCLELLRHVVTNGGIDLTENERVKFIQGDAVAELRQMKEDGDGMVVAYGEEIGALLLDNGLADEITVTTVPVLIGGGEKALECGLNDGRAWIVRSNKVLVDGKMRTVYGKV